MADKHAEFDNYIAVQRDMFRLAKADYALSPKRLALLSKIPYATIVAWSNGAAMPAWAFSILCRHIPDELTSMMMEPSEKFVGTTDSSDDDLDTLAADGLAVGQAVVAARHPASPGGVAIVASEKARIVPLARKFKASARRVAA